MEFTPVPCVICQCDVDSSAIAPCIKGHQQCRICSIRLNGYCGLCTPPNELESSSDISDGIIISGSSMTYSEFQDLIRSERSAAMSPDGISDYFEQMIDIIQSTSSAITCEYDLESQNFCNSTESNITIRTLREPQPQTQSQFSPSLMEILKKLHENRCSKSCTTFDYCIRQILYQQFDYSADLVKSKKTDVDVNAKVNAKGNAKVNANANADAVRPKNLMSNTSDSNHLATGDTVCNNKDKSVSSKLQRLAKKKGDLLNCKLRIKDSLLLAKERTSKLNEMHVENTSANQLVANGETNAVRAFYRKTNDMRLPQFEIVAVVPPPPPPSTPLQPLPPTPTQVHRSLNFDFSLPFFFDSDAKSACVIECPLQQCNVMVEDHHFLAHINEIHPRLRISLLRPNECKLFFIDPSVLEMNEVQCVAIYRIPNVFVASSNGEQNSDISQSLPIFVMVHRTNLNYFRNNSWARNYMFKTTCTVHESRLKGSDEILDAEVSEAVYGRRLLYKSKPIKWAIDDVLIVYPIAIIPNRKSLPTSLTIFVPNNPQGNFSSSFCMRSIHHSKNVYDLIGSPDTVCLTSVDIAKFTNDGNHVIHCQLMCRL